MKNTKKNSVMKKILPSACMLAVSAAMLSTSTYAWFTMNTLVSVKNMQVKATAEKGLLINETDAADATTWDNEATTSQSAGVTLHATSTANTSAWYVAYSKKSNSAAAATAGTASTDLTAAGYSALTLDTGTLISATAGTSALTQVAYVDADADTSYDDGEGYYVKYTYYLKSSGEAITCGLGAGAQSLKIQDVAVTGNTGSANLDKALRVAVAINGKAYIFAPLHDTAQSYYVNAAAEANKTTTLTGAQATSITSIPAKTATNGIPVYVYLYFEGEDPDLKTDNVTSALDDLTVSFNFALVDNVAAVTDSGVTIPTT